MKSDTLQLSLSDMTCFESWLDLIIRYKQASIVAPSGGLVFLSLFYVLSFVLMKTEIFIKDV